MQGEIADDGPGNRRVRLRLLPGPDWRRKKRVVGVSRNHMPVQMRDKIAETGKVDLFGRVKPAQRRLRGENQGHQMLPFSACKITHFAYMRAPDHPAEAWIINPLLTSDADHTAKLVFPEDIPSGPLA